MLCRQTNNGPEDGITIRKMSVEQLETDQEALRRGKVRRLSRCTLSGCSLGNMRQCRFNSVPLALDICRTCEGEALQHLNYIKLIFIFIQRNAITFGGAQHFSSFVRLLLLRPEMFSAF